MTHGNSAGARGGTAVRLAALVAGAVLTLVVGAVPAAAHNVLTGTTPAAGSTVGRTPSAVVLTFDEPAVAMGTQLLVTGPSGPVQTGPPRLVDNTVTQDLQGGAPAGAYTVAWRVTSADGHPVSGTFTFTSSQAGSGTAPTARSTSAAPAPPVTTGSPLPWWAALVAVLVVAAVAATVLVRRRSPGPAEDAGVRPTAGPASAGGSPEEQGRTPPGRPAPRPGEPGPGRTDDPHP